MMAVRMPFPRGRSRSRLLPVMLLISMAATTTESLAQPPPPRPDPPPEEEREKAPPDRPPPPREPRLPPPVLLVSADMPCRLELDGEPIGELQKDVVESFVVQEGDHLLQAFPIGIEGPTWKKPIKAPETGKVAVTIELANLVDNSDGDRFEVRDRVVIDHDTGLIWARNVSPAMRWEQAQGYCAGRDLDGIRGWRFPVLDELSTLHSADHKSPRQEMERGERHWTFLGPRRTETQLQPRLIYPPFEHNSVAALWIHDQQQRTSCSFLGGFTCGIERKKAQASVLCVRRLEIAEPAGAEASDGGR